MPQKPQGWRNEPARHSLAARGVETGHFAGGRDRVMISGRTLRPPPVGTYFVNHDGNVMIFKRFSADRAGDTGMLLFDEYSVPDEGYDHPDVGEPGRAGYPSMEGLGPVERRDGERLIELRNEVVNYRTDPIMFTYARLHEEIENYMGRLSMSDLKTKEHAYRAAKNLLKELEASEAPWTNVED